MSDPEPARRRIVLAWLPAVAYTLTIWWLSSQSIDIEGLEHVPWQDKGLHFLEYAGLGLCIAYAVHTTWPGRGLRADLAAVLITTGLGLLDELHQAFVPKRTSDARDLLADFLGCSVAIGLYALVRWLRRKKPEATPSFHAD